MSTDVVTSVDVQYKNVRGVCFSLLKTALKIQDQIDERVTPTGKLLEKLEGARRNLEDLSSRLEQTRETGTQVSDLYTIKNQLNTLNLKNLIFLAERLKFEMLYITDGDEENFKRRIWSYESIMNEANRSLGLIDKMRADKEARDSVIKSVGILQRMITWFDLSAPYGRCPCGEALRKSLRPGVYYKYCSVHRPDSVRN